MGKYIFKKALIGALIATTAGYVGVDKVNAMNTFQQNPENEIFEEDKVMEDVEYYGGDERYVRNKSDLLTVFTNDKTKYMTHLDTGHNAEIKVGYDQATVTDEQIVQFNHTFNHLNYLFDTINPDYHFVTGRYSAKESDIYVDFKNLSYIKVDEGMIAGATTDWDFDFRNSSVIKGAKIHFNNQVELATPELRYFMAHEMMHVLYGSYDVNDMQSPTFSVYNYCDVSYIVGQISRAYESIDDYKNGVIKSIGGHWKDLLEGWGTPHLPVMTLEEKHSFVSLLPTDVSTLVAIYGDSSTIENKRAYLDLLNEVLATNKKIFDIDRTKYGEIDNNPTEQPYYDDDFTLPEC